MSEALPGVPTPLTWWLFEQGCESGSRRAFVRIGLFAGSDEHDPSQESRMFGIFYGHPVINVNRTRWIADRTPGVSADDQERSWFGAVRTGFESHNTNKRLLALIVKAPLTYARLSTQMTAHQRRQNAWYDDRLAQLARGADPQAILAEVPSKLTEAFVYHSLGTQMASVSLQQLAKACAAAGMPGLEFEIGAGTGTLVEQQIVDDLEAVAAHELTLQEFLDRHGYNGPETFELSAASWRERPETLQALIARYRQPRTVPGRSKADRIAARTAAIERLVSEGGRSQRWRARIAVRMASKFIPMREIGKALFVQVFDVAREASRQWGSQLAQNGTLRSADDILYFTPQELLDAPLPTNAAAIAEERRRRRLDEHTKITLPEFFFGDPEPIRLSEREPLPAGDVRELRGVGASPGRVYGVARVVHDPDETDFVEGEILVCQTTDPSWVGLMNLASALVIDIGGPISHGAIIARELGVPCVIGALNATRVIRSGDVLTIDGGDGSVHIDSFAALPASSEGTIEQ
jgi:pyruvate,water dikinase